MNSIMGRLQETEYDEDDDATVAALILASLKYEILEPGLANKSEQMKGETSSINEPTTSKSTRRRKDSNAPPLPRASVPLPPYPEPGYSIDGSILPDYPPLQMIRDLVGNEISPPFEKQITMSDVDAGQSRISLNKSFVVEHYCPMLKEDEDLKKGIRVTAYGPDGKQFGMDFKLWADEKCYVLNNGWKDFANNYALKACTFWVTIWMFRHKTTGGLRFAFTWKINPLTTKLIPNRRKRPID